MSVSELLEQLSQRGVQLWVEGSRLRFRGPRGAMSAEQREQLVARRDEVITALRSQASSEWLMAPLSYGQQSLWFVNQVEPASAAYHVAFVVRVSSVVDRDAVRQALQALVDRHAILRTTYVVVDSVPNQRIVGTATAAFEVDEVGDIDGPELQARVDAAYRQPFDLERGPVLRATLFTLRPDDHVLLLTAHHIAVDGWSLLILLEEFSKLYLEATGGPAAGLQKPELEYSDYVLWQREMLSSDDGERLAGFWRDKLAAPRAQIELPADRPRPARKSVAGATLDFDLGKELSARLHALAKNEDTTLFVVLLAAFKTLLFRYTGTEDVVVGTAAFGRSKLEFTRIVGHFVSSLPLRTEVTGDLPFRQLMVTVRQTLLSALDAQEYPLPLMVERLQPVRDPSRSPLFETMFVLQRFEHFRELSQLLVSTASSTEVQFAGLKCRPYPLHQQEGQFDLGLGLIEQGDSIAGTIKYNADLFDLATVQGFANHYRSLLMAVVADPSTAVGALPIMDADERQFPIDAAGKTRAEVAPAVTLHERFEAQAQATSATATIAQLPFENVGTSSVGEPVAELLRRLRALDIQLSLNGERLKISAPKGVIDDAIRATIAARKDDIVESLRSSPASQSMERTELRRIPRTAPLPLSSAQQRLWFLDRIDPGRSHYNVGTSIRLRGPLDSVILRDSLREMVRRHETLRTRFDEADGVPRVEVLSTVEPSLEIVDLSSQSGPAAETEASRLGDDCLRRPFDLSQGNLARFLLVCVKPDDHVLSMCVHHIVSDGWSIGLMMDELFRLYEALMFDRPPEVRPLPVQYVDYAAWHREQLHPAAVATQLQYWKQQLAGAPTLLELPTDRPRPPVPSFRGRRVRYFFDQSMPADLKAAARRYDATLFMVLLAAWQVLLHRHSGQDDIVVGTPVANRDMPALEGLVGFFVNNVVLRSALGDNPTFEQFLAAVRKTTLDAFDHRDLPFDMLVDALRPERSASHAPVFQVLFALQSFPVHFPPPPGLTLEIIEPQIGAARFDLAVEFADYEGRLSAAYEYATDLFDAESIKRLHQQFERLLQAFIKDATCRIDDVDLLTDSDQRLLLAEWNATNTAEEAETVHRLFEAAAQGFPDAVAVVAGATSISYRQLDERANQLAHLLVARGVRPGALVAVCVDRTFEMPIAITAVLKAGAAYVPLDPTHPPERLRFTLEDAGVALVVTQSEFASLFSEEGAPLVLLDEVGPDIKTQPVTPVGVVVDPHALAYVIYTSGSTGRPKGVEVEHRNVVAFLRAMQRQPGFAPHDALLAVTTLSFDIAGLEIWLPLCCGGKVVIASRTDVLDGEKLAALLASHQVSVMQATPATWRLLLDAGWQGKSDLRILCGGEAMPRDLAAALLQKAREIWNMYGPTETTIWSTLSRVDDVTRAIPIGRPIANTHVFVLEKGQLAPIGVSGELCIGGAGVARGYRHRDELTAEKFVRLDLPNGRHERVYRTGDVVRFRNDGQLEFIGRRDHQVKVRGYRIELGEIETALTDQAGIEKSVVVVREDVPGDQRLVGYVVVAQDTTFHDEPVRAALRQRLPEYMVPNSFVRLSALPLTPNGKIDRKALPPPATIEVNRDEGVAVSDALLTSPQRRVQTVWREILRHERIGLHDNFFDVGGHSMLLVRLQVALVREFTQEISLVELFQCTTIATQAERLSSAASSLGALQRARARAEKQIHG